MVVCADDAAVICCWLVGVASVFTYHVWVWADDAADGLMVSVLRTSAGTLLYGEALMLGRGWLVTDFIPVSVWI